MTMSDVVARLTGSPRLPRDIVSGLVIFEHELVGTSKLNTCAPSITINPTKISSYHTFKTEFLSLLLDDDGFGRK